MHTRRLPYQTPYGGPHIDPAQKGVSMNQSIRDRLADRAFLFDDPKAYLAGVDAALEALEEQRLEDSPAVDRQGRQAVAPRR